MVLHHVVPETFGIREMRREAECATSFAAAAQGIAESRLKATHSANSSNRHEPVLISAGNSSPRSHLTSEVRRASPYVDKQHHSAYNQGHFGLQQVRRESAGRSAVLPEMRQARKFSAEIPRSC